MFSGLLFNILHGVDLGLKNQKVKKYLDQATCDSVAQDFHKVLSSQLHGYKERELLQTIFNKHCIEGYWNEESFKRHVRSIYSDVTVSNAALQLLWRSFHFYAYHPFPRDSQEVDFEAFQRGALLTAFQCDNLLGTQEFEWFWRNDAAFFRKAAFHRMFRSIGVPATTTLTQPSEQQNDIVSAKADAMDVLIMTVPQFMHAAPSPEELEVVAHKLFAAWEPTLVQREVRREAVSTLMNMLLRMRLSKEKWAYFYYLGDFAETSSTDEELTEALVNSLMGDEQTVTSDQLLQAMDMVPNLQLRFHQLWAVLFQPSAPTAEAKLSAPTHINAALSLFAPQFKTDNFCCSRNSQQGTRLALEKEQVSPDPHDTTIIRLVQALFRHPSACIMLFSSEAVATTPKTVIGAYFPGPLDVTITGAEKKQHEAGGTSTTSHLLFQLQPSFRLLRSGKPDVSMADLIRIKGEEGVSLAEIATNEAAESCHLPYWIGRGLRVDPEKKTATLASGDGQWYTDLGAGEKSGLSDKWEVVVQNPRMDIFMVKSDVKQEMQRGVKQEVQSEGSTRIQVSSKYTQDPSEPRVQGEELLKRIQGFGSS